MLKIFKIKMTKYFIFDTETTSLNQPSIIQFAYVICNENGDILEEYNKYWNTINPISEKSITIHNITPDFLHEHGINPNKELLFIDNKMKNCDKIIAHNINFDLKAINYTQQILNIPITLYKNTFCTMKESKNFVGLCNEKGWLKWPKLIELYRFLGQDIDTNKLHDALQDVKVLKDCYFLAKQQNFW
jgi:DNA polymerase III subunit epsilon